MSTSTPQPTADWLEKLGLGQYAQRFAENDINIGILPHLTDQDLKELGVVSLGHRRQLLLAIAELKGVQKGVPQPPATEAQISPRDTAERRQVTVMFSDLVGSTALSARMDPEDLREVISAYQKCVVETVKRFGGFVAKYMGDGALVYFGYPQAHEDDAERAVRAGLDLIQAVSGLKSGAPLQTRVGIATGLVAAHRQRPLSDNRSDGARCQIYARRHPASEARQARRGTGADLNLHPRRIAVCRHVVAVERWTLSSARSDTRTAPPEDIGSTRVTSGGIITLHACADDL